MPMPTTHNFPVRGNSRQKIQQFIVVHIIWVAKLFGEFVYAPNEEDPTEGHQQKQQNGNGQHKHGQKGEKRHREIECAQIVNIN